MTLNNLNARLYYVDKYVIISDSPSEHGPVLFFRDDNINLDRARKTATKAGFRLRGNSCFDLEGNQYYPLEVV